MKLYLLFLMASLLLGMLKPALSQSRKVALIVGMAFMLAVGYYVFRLV